MNYTTLPVKFQIREKIIISYEDKTSIAHRNSREKTEKQIKNSGTFTLSAQYRMTKIIDKWFYAWSYTNTPFSFITLTISSKYKKEVNHYSLLKQFIEKIEYRYRNINYVWKLELQQNGNPHFHILVDDEICWKNVRSIWNKLQSIYVDEYQNQQKNKYKNGYQYDKNLRNSKGEIIEEETQYKRYLKGNKANWRNPNSTDVEIVREREKIGKYIGKYIGKVEEEKNSIDSSFNRWWGCSDTLRNLKYLTVEETKINIEAVQDIEKRHLKTIEKDGIPICKIYARSRNDIFVDEEKLILEYNRNILRKKEDIKETLIRKTANKYTFIFGD